MLYREEAMLGPLLETKLYVPRRRGDLVPRPRLLTRLGPAADARLTLISAPAGFGKTTLLADWIATLPPGHVAVAWLSLDEHDNRPAVFWAYVIAALQRVRPESVAAASALLQSPQPPPADVVLTALINGFGAAPDETVLVLDDYHLIDDPDIQEGMTFLLDHLPPRLHLVIASRSDPVLPLARLRARGELVEVRAADLRFRPDEAATYLNEAMDLDLTAGHLGVLESRTEGWIAALQLAALSIQGRNDVAGFIEGFAGDDRYIVDYLVQEVLERQPEQTRSFLLQTSILERLNATLCDAVIGRQDGQAMLQALERGNVFVVPLDDRRRWYRYHHLFADVLRAHLADEQPERVPELHRRASLWYEQDGQRSQAIHHALAARDFVLAAGLIEFAVTDMLRSRQEETLRAWLDALPGDLVRHRPVLSAGYAGVLLNGSEFGPVEGRLLDAERALDAASYVDLHAQAASEVPAFVDEAQFRELPGLIALYRAGHSQVRGNLPDTVKYARLALERMPPDAPLRGGAMALLGLALWSSGEIDEAYQTYTEGIARVHVGGYVNDSSTLMFADMRIAQGRLREALSLYQRAIQLADAQGQAAPRGTADLHAGISEIYREMDDLDVATGHLATSQDLGERAGLPEMRYRWFTAMAAVKRARKDPDAALEFLAQAERLYAGGFSPDARPISAMKARIWIEQGRLAEASAWARDRRLAVNDDLTYLREFEHLTLARLLLAQARTDAAASLLADAAGLLQRLLQAAEEGGRTGSVIEVLVLQALVLQQRGDANAALQPLGRALTLAEPGGNVRVFLDEGQPMAALLREVAKGANADYARRLLRRFDTASSAVTPRSGQSFMDGEALSERELDVLRLLCTDLSGPDIARELVVALNTVRTHTKSIYTKLGVNSRREAVRRAGELHLL